METILPASDCLDLIKLMATAQHITAIIQSRQEVSRCPLCHHPSSRIHSRYIRHLLDLPWHGVAMRLELHVRRFFCDEPACRRHIFTERFSQVVAPYARRTSRLDDWFKLVGLALGGEAGARLLRGMGVATSPDALLMYIRSLPYTVPTSPRVVGIDEFAFRRGRVFGTILVDLERRRVLDLLPDCDQETVKRWLQQHSSIEIVSRDRAANFGEAIRQGAPQAIQVADRWHVLDNLGHRIETFWREHKDRLQTSRQLLLAAHPSLHNRTDRMERRSIDSHQNRVDLYHRVQELHQRGLNLQAIAMLLKITWHTASNYVHMSAPPARQRGPDGHPLLIDPFVPYLLQRWNEGCRNANQLWREIVAQGFTQSSKTVMRYLKVLRQETGHPRSFVSAPPERHYDIAHPPQATLTPRQAAKLFQRHPAKLTETERIQVERLCQDEDVATL